MYYISKDRILYIYCCQRRLKISMPLGHEWLIQHLYNWLVWSPVFSSGRFKQQMLRGKVRATREVLEAAREFLVPKILRSMKLGGLPEANSEFLPWKLLVRRGKFNFWGQKTYFRGDGAWSNLQWPLTPWHQEVLNVDFLTNMTQSRPKFFGDLIGGGCCWPMWQVFAQRSVKPKLKGLD